jgi:transcription initiation factor IIE alpha subunit
MSLVIARSNKKIARYLLLEHLKAMPKGSNFEANELASKLQIPSFLVKDILFEFYEQGQIAHLEQR